MSEHQKGRGDSVPSRTRIRGRERRGQSRSPIQRNGRKNKKKFRFFSLKWFILVLVTSVLLVVGGCSAVLMSAKTYSLKEIIGEMEKTSVIKDEKGKDVLMLGGANREYVKLSDLKSPELAEAFVKVEDERFYEHNGVDFKGMGRAVYKNIISLGKAEGASTITMQVARNAVLKDRQKTYTRKLNEISVSLNLEKDYSKPKILETYLNYIELGNDVRGIKMAAKIYFDKDITKEKLEPQEIALLAGLPKAPYGYNPYTQPEKAMQRRNVVLMKMAEDSTRPPIITEAEKEKAQKTELGVDPEYLKKHLKKGGFDAYKAYVMKEAEERYPGVDQKDLVSGGYKIYTALNQKAQQSAEEALKDEEYYQGNEELDAGLTMMNPKNGEVVAVGGGRHYLPGYKLRATENHQPGSTIKPIAVYAPAIQEKNFNEYSTVVDEEIVIGEWRPKNLSGEFYGKISMQEMVSKSLNASTIWLLKDHVTLGKASAYSEKAGLKLHKNDRESYAALALGGLTEGVDTVQMAQAYSALANNGKNTEAHSIRKIVGPDGTVLRPKSKVKETEVFSPKTSYYMNRMLLEAVQNGTGVNAQLEGGRPVAGKTGTTQNSQEAWFVGYTPQYVTAVTVFKDKPNKELQLTGGGYPARIFKKVMDDALEGTPVVNFQRPSGVEDPKPPFQLKPVSLGGGFDGKEAVNLTWNDYSDRLKYKVQRSEDQSSWSDIGETSGGSYKDTNIDTSSGLFGGGKTYYYRIIALDEQAEDGQPTEADPSNVLRVTVSSTERDDDDDEDEDENRDGEDEDGSHDQNQEGWEDGEQNDQRHGQGPPHGDQENQQPGDHHRPGNNQNNERNLWGW